MCKVLLYKRAGRFSSLKGIFISAIFLIFSTSSFAQKKMTPQVKELEDRADMLMATDNNFNDALPLFQKLDTLMPDNVEYKFKTGICFLNSKHKKANALPYLEFVANHYKPGEKNKYVDFEIYYFLGMALHVAYRFDDAIRYFELFKTFIKKEDPRFAGANREIEMCKTGKELLSKTSFVQIVNLGPVVNSPYPEYSPLITADESQLVFTSRRPGSTGGKFTENGKYYEDIYVSNKKNGEWSVPVPIDSSINTKDHEASVAFSVDGNQLIIYKADHEDGNLYKCNLEGDRWSRPEKLNSNVNSKHWEPSASLTADRGTLYFVSDRLGSSKGRDIFVSNMMPDGTWGTPKNLGATINTEFDEDAPFIHPSGKTLYFSSKGHNSMGGFDIFKSTMNEFGEWTTPENLGYPINTTDDDVFFVLSADGKHGYFSSDREGGYGDEDLYRVDYIESKELPLVVLKGVVYHKEDSLSSVNAMITVNEQSTGDLIGYFKPNSKTGKYLMILPIAKNFDVLVEEPGYASLSEALVLEQQKRYMEVEKNFMLSKEGVVDQLGNAEEGNRDFYQKQTVPTIDLTYAQPGDRIVLHNIMYDYNKATLRPESIRDLNMLITLLKENPDMVIELSSHTDDKGKPDYNLKLSYERSMEVVDYIDSHGISDKQIVGKGYGELVPIAPNKNPDGTDNPEGRQKNRRTEFKILKLGDQKHK